MRLVFLITAWLSTALAVIGAVLPLVPTTPFLLVAAWAFSRSSPHWAERIQRMPLFGGYVREWNATHSVPRAAKWKAWGVIVLSFAFSIYWVKGRILRLGLVLLGLILTWVIYRLPETPRGNSAS
ncbi:MAG: YbaN family protein [Planctomycetota bacterium]